MKKIISLVLTITLILAMLTVSVSVSAADAAKLTYKVKWSSLSYSTYWYNQNKGDMDSHYTVIINDNSIDFNGKSGNECRAYVSNEQVQISADTKFEYVFQAKNHTKGGSAGVVFAFANGLPYFIYGAFDNSTTYESGKSYIRVHKGLHKDNNKDCDTEFGDRYYPVVDLDSDGYGTYKIVFNGYTVSFYGLKDKSYEKIGNSITLPNDAQIALGAFNRENNSSGERTIKIRNAAVYAMNDAAAKKLSVLADGSAELLSYVAEIEKKYAREDYDKESYYDLFDALNAAKKLIEDGDYDANDVADARKAIDKAIPKLKKVTTDFTQLKGLIEKAEALNGAIYNPVAYKMLMNEVEDAKEILDTNVKQSEVNAIVDELIYRFKELDPDISLEVESDLSEDITLETSDVIYSNTGINTDIIIESSGGCGSVILASSALAVAALVGTAAIVFKKKED